MEVKIKLLPNGKIPTRGTGKAAGYDIYMKEDDVLQPFEGKTLNIGVCVQIPPNDWLDIRGRSSSFGRRNILVILGTVDEDYRGEVGVQLFNLSHNEVHIRKGERLAQFVLNGKDGGEPIEWILVDELDPSERNTNGFGSTGR